MNIENLIEGADAYTTLPEVADASYEDTPEATPTIFASAAASALASWQTGKWGC